MTRRASASELESKLDEAEQLFKAGKLSSRELELRRAVLLGIQAPEVAGPPLSTLEHADTKAKRELMAMAKKWVGELATPFIAAELWQALYEGGTGDDGLRRQLTSYVTSSPAHRAFHAAFREAGKGNTPGALSNGVKPAEALSLLRSCAREFLLGLAAALAVSSTIDGEDELEEAERERMTAEMHEVLSDERSGTAGTVLASIAAWRKAKAAAKRLRDGDDEEDDDPNSGKKRKTMKKTAKKSTLSGKKKKQFEGTCFVCGKTGHRASECTKKK